MLICSLITLILYTRGTQGKDTSNIKRKLNKEDTPQWRIYGLSIIGIFVLVSIILLTKGNIGEKNNTDNPQSPSNNIVTPKIIRAYPEKVAEGFPKNLALNSKTEITGSYSATYPNSSVEQATVEFISSKSSEANLDFYTKWAEDNGWDIVNSSKSDLISSLYLKKVSEQINIIIRSSVKIAAGSDIVISYVNTDK